MAMTGPIELRIDELVLHGVPAAERARVGAACERELARLLAREDAPLPPGLGRDLAVARLDAGAVTLPPGATGQAIGTEVARAVYRGLGGRA